MDGSINHNKFVTHFIFIRTLYRNKVVVILRLNKQYCGEGDVELN